METIANNNSFIQRRNNQLAAMAENAAIVSLDSHGQAVTTSLAIAEGVGNPHSTVIKLVRQYASDLEEFGGVRFQIQPFETAGGIQNREVAILNEQQSTLLMTYMRNNDVVREFKKRLVKAFYELANKARGTQSNIYDQLSDPASMRQYLLTYVEKVIELEDQIKVIQPKAAALDRLATADGSLCITDAAKQLQQRPKDLFALLQRNKWIYRRQGTSWLGYQDKLQQGLLEHKITEVERSDGTSKITSQVRVTPKGLTHLSATLSQPLQ
ncbi:phage regulatory protein/antirepressor Ant [Shewanella oncorhynchi]|uniref:phage regulatory protein/antirepressor Ant n=1 Tax=Shewanella TaxID=22 RepID=UPI0021D7FEF5|nr:MULTISPECIES: phage regulatory protein/antirepressor Ant [unclassified Shewanella]MCU7965175.1 phage regulatory protein/antirepressor Ant [Shewanella sp. SW32]MCU7973165.1 phage regulatory protein/antirepressor Ant [Shewanella sp. SW29]MCU8036924.1 phage regulatory protein/antirepressor Ant [Shewanella sp. SM69]